MSKTAAPTFFASAEEFRRWLEEHHDSVSELVVGLYKANSGGPRLTWPQAVREALCFGWIDGITRRIDDTRYAIRFTPRKSGSIWSAVNLRHVESLIAEGRMTPAGLAAYNARKADRTAIYSFEQDVVEFPPEYAARLAAVPRAAAFFEAQPASYRKTATWWVISAKRADTREKRLAQLIAASEAGERLPQFSR